MKLSDIRFPFTVTRMVPGYDPEGNPAQVPVSWSSKCAFKRISSKQALLSGVDTTTERAVITFYCLPEREILSNDTVIVRGKEWIPEGSCDQIEEGRLSFYRQMIKRG